MVNEKIYTREIGQISTDILVGTAVIHIFYIFVLQIHDKPQSASGY